MFLLLFFFFLLQLTKLGDKCEKEKKIKNKENQSTFQQKKKGKKNNNLVCFVCKLKKKKGREIYGKIFNVQKNELN